MAVLSPAPDVALAQVRRVALDLDGQPVTPSADLTGSFSEMALYVLVRRDGTWWLGQARTRPSGPCRGGKATLATRSDSTTGAIRQLSVVTCGSPAQASRLSLVAGTAVPSGLRPSG